MADKVTLDLKGLKQTLQNIEKWHRKADKLSEDALKQVGFAIETDAKRGVPVQYGTLKNSITTNWSKSNIDHSSVEGVSKPVSGKDEFIVAVGSRVKYSVIQEFGSWGDMPKTGKGEYPSKKGRKHVPKHRPAKGFLYLTRAYLKNRNKAKAQIAKELRKIT